MLLWKYMLNVYYYKMHMLVCVGILYLVLLDFWTLKYDVLKTRSNHLISGPQPQVNKKRHPRFHPEVIAYLTS